MCFILAAFADVIRADVITEAKLETNVGGFTSAKHRRLAPSDFHFVLITSQRRSLLWRARFSRKSINASCGTVPFSEPVNITVGYECMGII